jgi:hypothetical protein
LRLNVLDRILSGKHIICIKDHQVMSAAHYMVSIKTDMPTKNPRSEELKDSGNVAKKQKLEYTQWLRLQTLENGSTNVANKKEHFDENVLQLANNYKTEPLKSETEKGQETRVIRWIGNYLNGILDLMKETQKFKVWDSEVSLPKAFEKNLPEPSPAQMKKWVTSKADEDDELEEEAELNDNLDDETDVESDEEDEFVIDATKRDKDGQILYSFKNFKFLVIKLISELNEEGEDISEEELEFLSNLVKKCGKFYKNSLVKMLQDPDDGIQPCIEALLESRTLGDIIGTLLSIWDEDEYLLQLLMDLKFITDDTLLADARLLTEKKKQLEDKRIATFSAKKDIENAWTAENVEHGLSDKELKWRNQARKELQAMMEENGISSLEAQPEVRGGDGPRKSSRTPKPLERFRAAHFEVPLVSLDTGIRKIQKRLIDLGEMLHFLATVEVVDKQSPLSEKMNDELIPKWKRELAEMVRWGKARIQSREQRYNSEAQLLKAQHSQRSELQYKHNWTRFFLFKNIDGHWVDISGQAETEGHYTSLLYDSFEEPSIENPVLTMDKDYVKAKGLVILIPIDNLTAMGLVTPEQDKIRVREGYTIRNCRDDPDNCLMTITDPSKFHVQRISELYLIQKKELHALKLATPVGYEMKVGEGYQVWESHRKPGSYWLKILTRRLFSPQDLKKLNCPGLKSEAMSLADSGDEEDNPVLPADLLRKKIESIAAQRGLSDEQKRALEDLKRKWTAQRQPPPEVDVKSFQRYRSPEAILARDINECEKDCRSKGLRKQYLDVVREIRKRKFLPRRVLEEARIGRIASDKDGDCFIPSWDSPLAGPALKSFLEELEDEEQQAYAKLHSLTEDEEKKRLEIEALEEDDYAARKASAFAIQKQKVDAQLKEIRNNIKMIEREGGLLPENQERIRQLTTKRDELAKIETRMQHTQNDYERKRKQRDEEERQDLHEQKILHEELKRQHREVAEQQIILHPRNATEEAHRRQILLERYRQSCDKRNTSSHTTKCNTSIKERQENLNRGREMFSNADRSQFQGESLVPSGESRSSVVSSITERLKKFEKESEMRRTAAKEKAGAAGASGKSRDDFPNHLGGMFSQKLDEDLNDVRLCFLSLEP